ncbi:MAG TPA: SGNH/GDSL hydrolase family protein [Pyrinomonadaceae bacterium]|nr:SGNH/GDSL hydrolase family protein [Pyrinomonadaceae bacterium]
MFFPTRPHEILKLPSGSMMKPLLTGVFVLLFAASFSAQEKIEVTWYDAAGLGIDGKGWSDTKTAFDRLPTRAQKLVPDGVWQRSMNSAGMSVTFATNATTVIIRWKLRNPSISSPYLSSMSVAGLDLYLRDGDQWRWAATKPPKVFPETTETFLRGLTPVLREYKLYLPSYNGVEKVEIGVPKDSKFGTTVGKEVKKPIVFYGSSIVQGSASSRPGMTYVAQLGRRLDYPVVNLGFSGLCHMEPELADLLAELDPAAYVIDCLPNMQAKEVSERTAKFVKKLRQARPATPILLVENPSYSQSLWNPATAKAVQAKNKLLSDEFNKLKREGIKNIHYISGENLYGSDGNSTVDGVHPTDLGFVRMADVMEPVLRTIIETPTAK